MAFNYSPRIIQDGLVLYLDAANTKSYPTTGTTWSDLSRRGNNGTLTNGPTFNIAMSFTTNTGTPSNNAIIYLNGSAILTTTIKQSNNTVEVQLARGGVSAGSTQLLNGNISTGLVYNRALSATEVLQNYNATKSRFGL